MIQPWRTIEIFKQLAEELKETTPLSESNLTLAQYTSIYEDELRKLWFDFKQNPNPDSAKKLTDHMKKNSDEIWLKSMMAILGVDQLSSKQRKLLDDELKTHHGYIENSLLPDLIKAIDKGTTTFDNLDYRVIFLYAGALWSFGSIVSVMFDGTNLRDLADIFLFAGPKDEGTCKGERGCYEHVNKVYTVAQIIAQNIIPGRLRCRTSCRHILIPIASPLK